jgi:hypothetical protein
VVPVIRWWILVGVVTGPVAVVCFVDRIEYWRYSEPPSAEPATALALTPVIMELEPEPEPGGRPTTWAPEPLTPVLDDVLPGEGQWVAWQQPDLPHAVWVTSLRPLAIDTQGRLVLGAYGRDLVDEGRSQVAGTRATSWGVDDGGVTYVFRAALCTDDIGHLRFVSAGDVDAAMLADILVAGGCRTAVQLDINGTWPQFTLFDGLGTTTRTPTAVDLRMGNPYRYLNGSKKDFVAMFLRTSAQ